MEGKNQLYLVTVVFGILFLAYSFQVIDDEPIVGFSGELPLCSVSAVGLSVNPSTVNTPGQTTLSSGISSNEPGCVINRVTHQVFDGSNWVIIPSTGSDLGINCDGIACFEQGPISEADIVSNTINCVTEGTYQVRAFMSYTAGTTQTTDISPERTLTCTSVEADTDFNVCYDIYCPDQSCLLYWRQRSNYCGVLYRGL
jgi:hypothetical protein